MKLNKIIIAVIFIIIANIFVFAQDAKTTKMSEKNLYKTKFGEEFLKVWLRHKTYTLDIAKAMPEEHFNYKPTPDVRSFAEGLLHIAGANYAFSSMAKGVKSPFKSEAKSKKEILKVLAESFDFGHEALKNITESQLTETMTWRNRLEPSTKRTKKQVLHVMREHAAHHRGGLVIYLRLKGVKPPSFVD